MSTRDDDYWRLYDELQRVRREMDDLRHWCQQLQNRIVELEAEE